MTYGELKTRLTQLAKRSDLSARMANYVQDATDRINRRFGLSLAYPVTDSDTNSVMTDSPLLYLYAAAQSMYEDLNNGDNALYFQGVFNREADQQNITGIASSTNQYLTDPPQIKPV